MNALVALDFSDVTQRLLTHAERFVRATGGKLWLLHVAAPDPDFVGYGVGPQHVRDSVAKGLHEEHRRIQAAAESLREAGLEVEPLLVQGEATGSILHKATELECDLIILGSHGHGAMHHLLLGSVSEGVLRQAKCPVLVVPAESE